MTFKVQIIEFGTGNVVKEVECPSERKAERVDSGLNINLNHDHYYTMIIEEGEEKS